MSKGPFERRTPQRGSDSLQRFFSAFPTGWPGIGLLVLRSAAGAVAAAQSGLYLANLEEAGPAAWAVGLLVFVSAVSLIAGFLTPGAALTVSLALPLVALLWIEPAISSHVNDRVAVLLLIVDALALAALGPGAYSVDAYLFGRREIIIPHPTRHR
jgi:uncharacterized membrane protein YphA (DoxX/SURF4 family)